MELTHTVPRTVLFQKNDITMLIVCFHTWLRFWFWIHTGIHLSCYLLLAEIVKTVLKIQIWVQIRPEQ
jgi:hypothetical protein